jgi:hypothetical protein
VTRCVCEKAAKNVAKSIFWNLLHSFYRGKSSPIIWATSIIFTKTSRRKQSPNRRKFAQSGHPATGQNGPRVEHLKNGPFIGCDDKNSPFFEDLFQQKNVRLK